MQKNIYFLVAFFVLGLLLRVWFASVAYNDPRFDFAIYENFAKDFLSGRLAIDCCAKSPGYSAFLALVYLLFGFANYTAVQIIQVLLDLASGFLLYLTAKSIFEVQSTKIILALYMLNPFTSSYTGIILPEVLSIFLLNIIIFLLSRPLFSQKYTYWIATGIFIGILVFVRMQYFVIMMLMIPTIAWFSVEKNKRIIFLFVMFLAFLLASGYTLYGNYKKFNVLSILPPYQPGKMIMNEVFTRTGPYPEVPQEYKGDDPVRLALLIEYYNTPIEKMREMQDKYKIILLDKFKTGWRDFIKNYLLSIYWIWDKRNLFYYQDPWYAIDHWPVKIGNMALLFTAIVGLISYAIKKKLTQEGKNIFIFSLVLFASASFIYPLVSYESRHTISLYSLVILWAGYGLNEIRLLFVNKKAL